MPRQTIIGVGCNPQDVIGNCGIPKKTYKKRGSKKLMKKILLE